MTLAMPRPASPPGILFTLLEAIADRVDARCLLRNRASTSEQGKNKIGGRVGLEVTRLG